MATTLLNCRIDEDAREWLAERAKEDDRNIGVYLTRLIRSLMECNENTKKLEDKPAKTPAKRKTQWPKDFELNLLRGNQAFEYWASKDRIDLQGSVEWEKFNNYCQANGKKYINWDAAWRTWYTNAVDFNKPPMRGGRNGISKQSNSDRLNSQATSLFEHPNESDASGENVVATQYAVP